MIFASVIVCTRGRNEFLRACLSSLRMQTAAPDDFEIIVVDNNDAPAPFDLPENAQCVHEPRVGLGHARNRGWRAARGEWLAFIDDDAQAAPDWVENMSRVREAMPENTVAFGGRVLPLWETPRPTWLDDELLLPLSLVDLGDAPCVLPKGETLVGCNLVLSRAALQAAGGFNTELGRRDKNLMGMEETLLERQFLRRGNVYWYDPALVVYHHIRAERLHPRWFVRHSFWNGISNARAERIEFVKTFAQRRGRIWRALQMRLWQRRMLRAFHPYAQDGVHVVARCALAGWTGYILGMLF